MCYQTCFSYLNYRLTIANVIDIAISPVLSGKALDWIAINADFAADVLDRITERLALLTATAG